MTSSLRIVLAAFVAVAATSVASANPVSHVFGTIPLVRAPLVAHDPPYPAPAAAGPYFNVTSALSGTWQTVAAAPPFGVVGAGTALLMTDGTVMVHNNDTRWYRLSPDKTGSYVNGTWSSGGVLPAGYGPRYFASAVLPDGRLVMSGGEYNLLGKTEVETNLGAIYNPYTNTWAPLAPPPGWLVIGDAQSVILNNGTFLLGDCCYKVVATLNASTLAFSWLNSNKADADSEEGWTLLPNGTVFTVDVSDPPNSEIYNPSTGLWASAGKTPVALINKAEIGPQILRPDGTIFVVGATGNTAIYNTLTRRWSAGPTLPKIGGLQLDVADGPGSLLPDGNVLFPASVGVYKTPSYWFEFDGTHLNSVAAPPNAPVDSTYYTRTLLLPTGQVLETDSLYPNKIEVYTPRGTALPGLAPIITSLPTTLIHAHTYKLAGQKLNGYSQANAFGDDAQMATNFPLVRITDNATKHVFYARTHTFSFMGVASLATVTAEFDVPAGIERGPSTLVVVANGVPSAPKSVTIE